MPQECSPFESGHIYKLNNFTMKKSQIMAAMIAAKKAQAQVDAQDPYYRGTIKRSYFQPMKPFTGSRTGFEARSIIKRAITSRSKYVSDARMQAFA
jgi:hypothetical protein